MRLPKALQVALILCNIMQKQIDFKNKIFLAPMQGLCDDVMRDLLTRIGGYDACVSEFVRITHTVHSKHVWHRHMPELQNANRTAAGTHCILQLLGSNEQTMAQNAQIACQLGADHIDLNFGCPAPTVNQHQGGAILLREPERIYRIVHAVRQAIPLQVALSAKMRLGYEDKSRAIDCAQAIEAGGAQWLTVHARTKTEGYRPPAHWDEIAKIRPAIGIPVIANGDVFSLADYLRIRQISGCDAVMLGRGAVMVPDLARQIAAYLRGEAHRPAEFAEILAWMRLFIRLCQRHSDKPNYPMARLKQWLGMMKTVYAQAAQLFEQVRVMQNMAQLETIWQTHDVPLFDLTY